MKKIYFGFICCVFYTYIPAQTTVTLNPSKDNTIYQESENSNGIGDNFFTGNTNNGNPRRALLMFDLSGIPSNAVVSAASLKMYCTKTSSGSKSVTLYKLSADWGEGSSDAGSTNDGSGTTATANDVTWTCEFSDGGGGCLTAWTTAGGVFSATPSAATFVNGANTSYNWSGSQLLADVQNWINNSSGNFGWIVIGDEASSPSSKRFGSTQNATASQRPVLSVTYSVPTLCPGINTWTGAISSAWETPGNWSCGSVPNANTSVIINSGPPVIVNSNAICKNISINPSVTFTVNTGFNFTVVQ